jgi:hypothetical protein
MVVFNFLAIRFGRDEEGKGHMYSTVLKRDLAYNPFTSKAQLDVLRCAVGACIPLSFSASLEKEIAEYL